MQLDLAAARVDEPEEHPDGRRLARAVGAQEAEHDPLGDGERKVVNRGKLPEALRDVTQFDRVVHICPCVAYGLTVTGLHRTQVRMTRQDLEAQILIVNCELTGKRDEVGKLAGRQ